MSGRVLIIQLAKLGDFIQSTPLLAQIRRRYPGASIVLAAEQPAVLAAAALSPLVDEAVAAGEGAAGPAGPFEAIFVLNSHARAAGLAAGLEAQEVYGPRLEGGRLIFTPAQEFLLALMVAGREMGRFNLVDVWLSLAPGAEPGPLVWPVPGPGPDLPPGLKIGFQLGSRNHLRRWPVEHFVSLAAALAREHPNFCPVLLGAAEERALGLKFEKLLAQAAPGLLTHNLMGRTDLAGLGAAVAGLDLLVTADTGVMHLAAALKRPVLSLFFGPAHGPETGPYGPGHLIYQATAPCGPCREAADCRRRQCLEMPRPETAARLAGTLLPAPAPSGAEEIAADLPPGHRVWRTAADNFGQSLIPLGRPPLSGGEGLALLVTEAGRGVMRPGYVPSPAALGDVLAAYGPSPEPPAVNGAVLQALADNGFPQRPHEARAFLRAAGKLAASVGLKLAS